MMTATWYAVAPSPPATASWLNTDTLSPFWAVLRISKLTQAICTLNPCWDNCSVNIGCFLSPGAFIMCLTPLSPKGHQVASISRTNTCSAYTSLFYTSFWYQQKFPESNQLPPWISCVRHSWPFAQTKWITAWVICGIRVQIIWTLLTATDRAQAISVDIIEPVPASSWLLTPGSYSKGQLVLLRWLASQLSSTIAPFLQQGDPPTFPAHGRTHVWGCWDILWQCLLPLPPTWLSGLLASPKLISQIRCSRKSLFEIYVRNYQTSQRVPNTLGKVRTP